MKSDEKPPADITRREALKKIGLYVPPTLVVLTAAPRAFAGSPEPPPPPLTATIEGYVYRSGSSGSRVSGVMVSVNCNPFLWTSTNSQGEYTITNIPPGTWETVYSHPDYDVLRKNHVYNAGEVLVKNEGLHYNPP